MPFNLAPGDLLAIGSFLLAMVLGWLNLRQKIDVIHDKVRTNEKNHYANKERMDLFQQQILTEINGFKDAHMEQLSQSKSNGTILNTLCVEQRTQSVSQDYMRELISDVKKSLDANTNATAGLLEFLRHQYGKRD